MPTDYANIDEITETRRKAIEESIQPLSVEDLKTIGEGLFPQADHPWREKLSRFLGENASASFYHATAGDRVHVVYCPDREKGMWFVPGFGAGPLQAKGVAILKEIVEELD